MRAWMAFVRVNGEKECLKGPKPHKVVSGRQTNARTDGLRPVVRDVQPAEAQVPQTREHVTGGGIGGGGGRAGDERRGQEVRDGLLPQLLAPENLCCFCCVGTAKDGGIGKDERPSADCSPSGGDSNGTNPYPSSDSASTPLGPLGAASASASARSPGPRRQLEPPPRLSSLRRGQCPEAAAVAREVWGVVRGVVEGEGRVCGASVC